MPFTNKFHSYSHYPLASWVVYTKEIQAGNPRLAVGID